MTNILLVPVNDLVSHPTETRFISIATKLVEKSNVDLFALRYKEIPTGSKGKRNLKFSSVGFKDIRTRSIGSYYIANSIPVFFAILRELMRRKIDVVIHANILPSAIAVCLAKMTHIPIIFDYQDHFPESAATYYKGKTLGGIAYSFTCALNNFNIKYSNVIVTVTNAHKELIKKSYPSKPVIVIPNGVNMDLFRPIPASLALKELNLQHLSSKKLLLYFGSIDSWLDFDAIFKVIKRLSGRGIEITFLVVGYSHSKFFLKQLKENVKEMGIDDRVLFIDPVPQSRLVYYINACDVTIAPLKPNVISEAVPLKILESLACGKPVLSTRLSEIVNRFKEVVSMYSSEEELESGIMGYLMGKATLSSEKMIELVRGYSWDNFGAEYYELVKKITDRSSRM